MNSDTIFKYLIHHRFRPGQKNYIGEIGSTITVDLCFLSECQRERIQVVGRVTDHFSYVIVGPYGQFWFIRFLSKDGRFSIEGRSPDPDKTGVS
jgi:hypothetical protein